MSFKIKTPSVGLLVSILVSAILLSACAPSVKVRSDVAPDVNMSQFQTYNFFSQLGVEDDGYSSLLGQHFRDAVFSEMDVRGFKVSETPQLQVNVSIGAKEKVKVNTYQDPYLYGGAYGYRGGYGYYGSPWYGGGTRTSVHQYTEAQVYIDFVDSKEHKLVWQGVATFTLTDKMQEQVRETVQLTVSKVFEQLPVPAPGQQ